MNEPCLRRASDASCESAVSHRRSETRHKTEVISVRCTPEEKAAVAAWAAAHAMSVSEAMLTSFLVTTIVAAVREQVVQR